MPDDATPAVLRRLLDLQTEDTAMKVLETRRSSLPEARRLGELSASLAEMEADLVIATKQADEIRREQSRLEDAIKLVEDKIGREEQRMFSGSIANPKELSALQAEVESLKRRRGDHEDSLLDVMVAGESATETVGRLTVERDQTRTEADELGASVDAITGDIDAELTVHKAGREVIAPEIPERVLKLYDDLREQKGGVGAAALVGGTCEGCHTKLPNKEAERVRAEGGLQRCDNCRRILVVD